MTVSVNSHSEQERNDILLTTDQEKEVSRRDEALQRGTKTARNWEEIKMELGNDSTGGRP
jgi:hypothetical protein